MPQPQNEAAKEAFIKFLVEKCETATEPFVLGTVIEEFRSCNPTNASAGCFRTWFAEYRQTIRSLSNLGNSEMVKQLFAFKVVIDPAFFKKLKQDAHVELFHHRSGRRTIRKYVANDGSFHFEGSLPNTARSRNSLGRKNQVESDDEEEKEEEKEEEEEEEDTSDAELVAPPVPKRQKMGSSTGQSSSGVPALSSSTGRSLSTQAPSQVQNAPVVTSGALPNGRTSVVSSQSHRINRNDLIRSRNRSPNAPNNVDDPVHENLDDGARQPIDSDQSEHNLPPNINAEARSVQTQTEVENGGMEDDVKPQIDREPQINQEPQGPEVPKPKTFSLATHKQFVKSMQTLIEVLGLPMDSQTLNPPIELIERCEISGINNQTEFEELEIENLSIAINYSIMRVQKEAEVKPNNNSKSLRRYLDLLLFIITDSRIEELEETKQQLKDAIGKIGDMDKLVDVSAIMKSLEVILDILIPQ